MNLSTLETCSPINWWDASRNFRLSSTISTVWNMGSKSRFVILPIPAPQSSALWLFVFPFPTWKIIKNINLDKLFLSTKKCLRTPQNNRRTNTINYNIDVFCVDRILKTDFTIYFGHLWSPIAKWNSKKKMVEKLDDATYQISGWGGATTYIWHSADVHAE